MSSIGTLKKRHIINLPPYGLITIPEICKTIIDTPEFETLNEIMQLGMTYHVFPGATHKRKAHSLGVMHLTGVFFDNLLNNTYLDEKTEHEYKKYKVILMVAGLCHDIGHRAFSHLFEEAMKLSGKSFNHEEYGLWVLDRINSRLRTEGKLHLSDEELMIVKAAILGKPLEGYPAFLFEIVANKRSGLDTDKMEYLPTDARNVGKPGLSFDYVMANVHIVETEDGERHVGFSHKVRNDVMAIFKTRQMMYEEVYFHKTVTKIDKIMICAISQLDIDPQDYEAMLDVTDAYIMYKIKHEIKHDFVRCIGNRTFDHHCDHCPKEKLKRVAKLSGDTDSDPIGLIYFSRE
jgi:HD superfamily phosphohydrolase